MYELSLNVDKKDGHFLDYLARQLDRPLAQARGVSALEEIDDRTFFSLACYDESAGQMSALVKDLLADIFSIGYKNKYLSKKLNMGSEAFAHADKYNVHFRQFLRQDGNKKKS